MMGYEKAELPLWKAWQGQFPVADRYVYLNHAAVAPLSHNAALAMAWLASDTLYHGALHYERWLEAYDGVRKAASLLINAEPAEIALMKNTSEGVATVALGIDWRWGDKVVAFREEFPANFYPWKRLEEKGVQVEWLSILSPLEEIDKACRGARLLAISFVNYLTGYRVDLEGIGGICKRHGTFYFVDAIQGLGAYPIDVRGCGIHALAADGHKWLLGPEGCGLLYIQRDWQDSIFPVEFGWTNVAKFADYSSRDMALRDDAGRYECGTLNTIGCFGLRAAVELILEVGVERITPAVTALADRIAEGVVKKDYELSGPRNASCASGIVSFRKPGVDSRMLVAKLKEADILAAPRQGWVRASPHFYVDPSGIEKMLELL
ncbi:MAG: aminotransferase class V-fold PLP-dependent enzyme [Candidatus Solibacter usitatus]|nr:aminotransferase class V-fold PLP-dependent enzyme [Candidatus Solibacter usitatus]